MATCLACNRFTALVIEDDAPMRHYLCELLLMDDRSTRVLDAADGAAALSMCADHPPNLILVDLGLPDVDGMVLLRQMRRLAPNAVIVVVSCAQPNCREDALATGADAYIEKYDVYRDLIPTIRNAVSLNGADTAASVCVPGHARRLPTDSSSRGT